MITFFILVIYTFYNSYYFVYLFIYYLKVKRIEKKEQLKKKIIKSQKSVSICCKGEGKFVPMKVAIQEASSKNSLLERINSLETRLFQVKYFFSIYLFEF